MTRSPSEHCCWRSAPRISLLLALCAQLSFSVACGPTLPSSSPQGELKNILSKIPGFATKELVKALDQNAVSNAPLQAPQEGVILQVFNWSFDLISSKLPEIAALGYTHVHVSPPNLTINRNEWWARYQPIDYRVIAGPLGDEASFSRMNQTAERLGIKVIADVVLNHMANPDFARFNERYTDNPESLFYPDPNSRNQFGLGFLFRPEDFNPAACIQSYEDRQQVLYNRLCLGFPDKGLPDLNLSRPNVLEAQRIFLRKLADLGVDGFRIDALKHIPPDYINKVLEGFDPSRYLIFGEIITDSRNLEREIRPYAGATNISFYDFPLVHLMKQAFLPSGSMRLLADPISQGAALPGNRAVTFIVNHDLPNNGDIFKYLLFHDRQEENLAYAYILGRADGLAYVYTDLGRAGGLDSDRFLDAYADPALASMMKFRQAVAGQTQNLVWESDQVIAWRRGRNGLVVINKSGTEEFDLARLGLAGLADGSYKDVLSELTLNLRSGRLRSDDVSIPTRAAALFLRD